MTSSLLLRKPCLRAWDDRNMATRHGKREPNWPADDRLLARIQRAVDTNEVTMTELGELTGVSRSRWSQILAGAAGIPNLPQVLWRLRLATSAWLPGLATMERDLLSVLESVPYSRQREFIDAIRSTANLMRPKADDADDRPPKPDQWRPTGRKNAGSGG